MGVLRAIGVLPGVGALLAVAACGETGPPPDAAAQAGGWREAAEATPAIEPLPGTARAVSELDSIYRAALEEPMRYGHLNARRAEAWREEIGSAEGAERMMARYQYAFESLSAGEEEAAIRELDRLIEDAAPEDDALSSRTKSLFELLALAHLKLGEERNRARSLAAGASILPLTADAVHTEKASARRAVGLYRRIVDRFPYDLQSRWLLNLGYVALGEYPDGVPADLLIPGLDAGPEGRSSGAVPRFPNLAPALGVAVDGIAGGVSVEDFDGDGHLDILATSRGLHDPMRLFFADGEGRFVDHTRAAGLTGLVGGLNTVHADYDNDGHPDVLILRGGWLGAHGAHPNSLLRNRGDRTFEDVAEAAGVASRHPAQTAAWGDFDNDGWVDLFVGNEGGPNGGGSGRAELHRNLGDGTFAEVSAHVGIDLRVFVKGAAWGDVDNDGLIDLYVSVVDGPNRLYLNRGGRTPEEWRFEEAAARAGVQEPVASFPVLFWDFDNDGWEDLFVASFDVARSAMAAGEIATEYLGRRGAAERNRLYRNQGDGTFADVAPAVGLDRSLWTMGLNVGDLDDDGFLDLYLGTGTPDLRSLMPNRMFRNEAGARFRDVTFEGGFGHIQKGHAIAFADFDRDGDQDIYAVMGGAVEGDHFPNALFENPGFGEGNARVVLRLEGRTANRSAIGARIRVTVTGPDGERRVIYRTVTTGGSFGASSLQQEIGLGRADRIDELRIRWPNREGSVDVHTDLAVDRYYRIVEGEEPVPDYPS